MKMKNKYGGDKRHGMFNGIRGCIVSVDIEKIKTIVIMNVSQIRSVKELALMMNVSIETLRKDFRRKEAEPLSNFLTRARLEEMKKLLLNTNLCCCEVCYHVGSRDDSGHKFFRRETGMTMETFRIMHKTTKTNNRYLK